MEEYIAVDLEMTGLRVTQDRILEIGAVRIRGDHITDRFSSFVNPHRNLSEKIIGLTGITDEMVEDAPEAETVMKEFLDFAGEAPLIGHNLMFDFSFLKQCAVNQDLTFERGGIDTLKLARALLEEPEKKSLESLCAYYGIREERSHRALYDAEACARIYLILKERFAAEHPELFEPKPLRYRVRRQSMITLTQKRDLNHLLIYHKIKPNMDISHLTRSEASRLIDRIHAEYGRIPKTDDDGKL